jgi:hypothetical protein
MTEQTPESTPQGQAPVPTPPPGNEPEKGKQPPWGDPENFKPEQAWELIQKLRSEKGDPNLRDELDTLRQQQTQQRDALAAALGIKPEETSDTDKLATQIETLRGQIVASERRAIAVESRIPEEFQHMLTATDPEGLRKQAADLVRFAEAAHFAAASTQPAPPPAFQQNPGQGQGGAPLTPEAQAAAEYEKYYPASKR